MRVIGIGNASDSTMTAEEAKRYFNSTASTVIKPHLFTPEIELVTPVIKKRGKYWQSPKYKFKGEYR